MAVFAEHDRRFESLEPRTGLFLGIAALIVVATIIASLVKHDAFTRTMNLYAFARSGQGIHKGMAVHLSGFRIGSVGDLELQPDARVKLTLVIESRYAPLIPRDAEVGLSKEGMIGASFIEIDPSESKGPPVAADGVLKFYRATDFTDLARDIKEKIEPILDDVKRITASVDDPNGDIRQAIHDVRQVAQQAAALARRLDAIAVSTDRRIQGVFGKVDITVGKTSATLDRATSALDSAGRALAVVEGRVPDLLLRLDQSLKNVQAVTADAHRLSSGLTEELPPAVRDSRGLIEDTREIVDGAKQSWPIRNLVPPSEHRAIPMDSYDEAGPR